MSRIYPQNTRIIEPAIDPPTPDYEPTFEINPLASEKAIERSKKEKESIKFAVLKIEGLQKLTTAFMGKDLYKQNSPFIFNFEEKKKKRKRLITISKNEINELSLFSPPEEDSDLDNKKAILLQGEQKDTPEILSFPSGILTTLPFIEVTDTPTKHSEDIFTVDEETLDNNMPIAPLYLGLFLLLFLSLLIIAIALYENSLFFSLIGFFISLISFLSLFYLYSFNKNI